MDLEKLIKACKKNNLKAQSELYSKYKDSLYLLCLKYCKNVEEAEDNLQDSFISIFKSIKKYNNKGSFEGWMKRITINKAIDKYKKESFINVIINNDLLKDDIVEVEPISLSLDELLEAIQELPTRYRLVFNLYELDNFTHQEIAQLLSISVGTSKSNLHRAKSLLRDNINKKSNNKLNKKSNGN
ncbi:RNA polymerase sigma factor [Lacinutrix sp. 5H-3-7-4]|uniref:RNA polymerase sigma factor n=1 Tax=Lacinutrix sp. (strain 5H-3-7-4) TaxID=983544 RepID=UPI00020A3880|nr:RNA polymerase sigma factor [Lacinutrix sp. 5H-3-7-4]AEH00387.1 RNA polymerase, sigma-24 subunit, ECF subfamily [Lacinutrix sp. 5H-3-7-4]